MISEVTAGCCSEPAMHPLELAGVHIWLFLMGCFHQFFRARLHSPNRKCSSFEATDMFSSRWKLIVPPLGIWWPLLLHLKAALLDKISHLFYLKYFYTLYPNKHWVCNLDGLGTPSHSRLREPNQTNVHPAPCDYKPTEVTSKGSKYLTWLKGVTSIIHPFLLGWWREADSTPTTDSKILLIYLNAFPGFSKCSYRLELYENLRLNIQVSSTF